MTAGDRHAADERLREAVIAHARAYGTADPDEGGLLDQVLLVSSWVLPEDDDDEPRTLYTTQHMGGNMPHHVILGLLAVARHIVDRDPDDDGTGL